MVEAGLGTSHFPGEAHGRFPPGAGTLHRAPTTSGVKAAQRPKGLALIPAQGGGARWRAAWELDVKQQLKEYGRAGEGVRERPSTSPKTG